MLVNKPAKIVVSGDKPHDLHSKVLSYLQKKDKLPKNTSFQPINIHRLDINTSGIVIFSLNYSTHRTLSELMGKENYINKHYIARVVGDFPENITLKDKMAHNETEQKMIINRKYGKIAKLEAFKIKTLANNRSLIEVKLLTGRKHQIRLQLSNAKHPIVGDPRYGGPKAELINLCAYKISFSNLEDDLKYLNDRVFIIKRPK